MIFAIDEPPRFCPGCGKKCLMHVHFGQRDRHNFVAGVPMTYECGATAWFADRSNIVAVTFASMTTGEWTDSE